MSPESTSSASASAPVMTAAGGRVYDPRAATIVLVIIAGMALMVTYVETMVLPAFSTFQTFFELPATSQSTATITWIISAYLLVGTVATPIFGRLGDIYGKKRMLLVAMSIYAAAVTVAGFTPNIGSALGVSTPNQIYLLIGVRAIQGIGMGMFPLGFAMLPEVFPASRVGESQGIVSAMFAAGAALGLVGGGWISQSYGWQLTYHTVIPVAIILVVAAALLLRESPTLVKESVDIPGVSSLGFGLAMLLLGITEGADWGWTNFNGSSLGPLPWGVPEFFILAAVGFAFFVWWEDRAKEPVVRLASLKIRNILVSNVNGLLVGVAMFLMFVTDTILFEYTLNTGSSPLGPLSGYTGPGFGFTPLTMGLLTLPAALGMLTFGPILGRRVGRIGPKPIMMLGFAFISIGGFALIWLNHFLIAVVILPILVLVGIVGVLIAMSNVIVLSVSPKELGIQTGMNQTFRNLGSAIGPVLVASILASFTTTYLLSYSGGTIPVGGFADAGFQTCFAAVTLLGAIGFGFSLALRNYRFAADGTREDTGARNGAPPMPRAGEGARPEFARPAPPGSAAALASDKRLS
ncbi:MAG: MFS transporter [Thermoplasmata archaeon]|nr:MFS transporter [Thermoplasmata archaeon]